MFRVVTATYYTIPEKRIADYLNRDGESNFTDAITVDELKKALADDDDIVCEIMWETCESCHNELISIEKIT